MHKDPDSNSIEDPMSITGLETFSLSYKVCSFLGLSAPTCVYPDSNYFVRRDTISDCYI